MAVITRVSLPIRHELSGRPFVSWHGRGPGAMCVACNPLARAKIQPSFLGGEGDPPAVPPDFLRPKIQIRPTTTEALSLLREAR
jgi:hypothetical protein